MKAKTAGKGRSRTKKRDTCVMCPKKLRGKQRNYCSRACQEAARRRRKKQEVAV